MRPYRTFPALAATLMALSACSNESGVVITEPDRDDDEFLTVMERFETAYVGNWQEDGNCASGDEVLSLRDERVSYGEVSCDIEGLSKGTARVRMRLTNCETDGTPTADRTYVLDLAGDDILYITGSTLSRTRLEACPA